MDAYCLGQLFSRCQNCCIHDKILPPAVVATGPDDAQSTEGAYCPAAAVTGSWTAG